MTGSFEVAEGWAVDQIASIFAIDMGAHFGYDGTGFSTTVKVLS